MSLFKKAERMQTKLKIALTGPSGSGKTFSSLLLATGLGQKIAVIDTENRSAALYSDRFEFDLMELEPPYTVDKYLNGIRAAQQAGYDVLIVDSISHQWAGEGGILEKKSALDSHGGNSYTNWGKLTPEQERFKSAILQSDIHLICTMRSKQEYVLQQNEKGKQAPIKVGMAPIQRDGMEYEFTTVFDIGMDHNAIASKDRTGLFDGVIAKVSKKTGENFMSWLAQGKVAPAKPAPIEESKNAAPTQASVTPIRSPNGSEAFCEKCGTELVLSSSGAGYYCPGFKNEKTEEAKGLHTRFKADRLEEFKTYQKSAVK